MMNEMKHTNNEIIDVQYDRNLPSPLPLLKYKRNDILYEKLKLKYDILATTV